MTLCGSHINLFGGGRLALHKKAVVGGVTHNASKIRPTPELEPNFSRYYNYVVSQVLRRLVGTSQVTTQW